MSKTVAVLVIKNTKSLSWLGHMPILNWSLTHIREVRGVDRIVCVAAKPIFARVQKLLSAENVETIALPNELSEAKDDVVDKWLTAANGVAADADVVIVSKCSSPFLPGGKIEACLMAVRKNKCTHAQPAREVLISGVRKVKADESVESVRVFKVNVPVEKKIHKAIRVSMIESLDVEQPDEYVLADALLVADKI